MKEQPKSANDREYGYYWVNWYGQRWEIARYSKMGWELIGDEIRYEGTMMKQVGPKISRVSGEPPKPGQTYCTEFKVIPKPGSDLGYTSECAFPSELTYRCARRFFEQIGHKIVSGEAKTTDLDMAGYWRREYFKAHICEEELTANYLEALVLLNEAKDMQMNSNLPARIKLFLDGETETKTKYSSLTGGSVPTPSDLPTDGEIIRRAFDQRLQYNLPQAWSVGYEVGAKWILEWLRGSTEQRLGNSWNKG